jgi:hypothetical protein
MTAYYGQTVETAGYPLFVSEETYFMAYPYYDPALGLPMTSLSQVIETTYYLYSNESHAGRHITFVTKSGGMFLPLPVVMTSRPEYPRKITVYGTVIKDSKGNYLLSISEAVTNDTS